MIQKSLEENNSILKSKLINSKGYKIQPAEYFYQLDWIKEEWKGTELLQFIHLDEIEEAKTEEVETVKEEYDVELTSLDVAQKIKIIKTLR